MISESFSFLVPWKIQVPPRIIFFHIPKTGGTTFRKILVQLFQDRYRYCEDPHVRHIKGLLKSQHCVELHVGNYKGKDIYFHKDIIQKEHWSFLKKMQLFVMFRDPVDRVISNYFELARKRYKEKGLTPQRSLLDELKTQQPNKQVGYMLGNHPSTKRISTTEDLEYAKHLLTELNFNIGILERYAESLQVFESVTQKRIIDRTIHVQNRTGKDGLESVDQKTRDFIREKNQLDQELYEFAGKLFENQVAMADLHSKEPFQFEYPENSAETPYWWEKKASAMRDVSPENHPTSIGGTTTVAGNYLRQSLPQLSYIILSTPRSGSTYLCEALHATGLAGNPREHFLDWFWAENEPERLPPSDVAVWSGSSESCLKTVLERGTRNGIFGLKIMPGYLNFVLQKLKSVMNSDSVDPSLLFEFFPDLRLVYLQREDRMRQAVSLAKAQQSGKWHRRIDPATGAEAPLSQRAALVAKQSSGTVAYDFELLKSCYIEIQKQTDAIEKILSSFSMKPFVLTYENLVQPGSRCLEDLLDYLGLSHSTPLSNIPIRLTKMADSTNDDWVARFAKDLRSPESAAK